MSESTKRVCAVVGVGPGNGAAFARRFASEGVRCRSPGAGGRFLERARGDATRLASLRVRRRGRRLRGARLRGHRPRARRGRYRDLQRAGSGTWGTIEDASAADFESAWRVNALGAFVVSKQVIPAMKKAGRGSFVFVGATASRRGGAKTAAFASSKAACRGGAGPSRWRVICGPRGSTSRSSSSTAWWTLPRTRERMLRQAGTVLYCKPADVADIAFRLTEQRPSAWSFEVEARPFGETWVRPIPLKIVSL